MINMLHIKLAKHQHVTFAGAMPHSNKTILMIILGKTAYSYIAFIASS